MTGKHVSGALKRVGLFGGTFDPIHRGHLDAAKKVGCHFCLDVVYFIPAARPPHKSTRGMASAKDRIAMILAAISGSPGLAVSDVELNRTGPSYTVDTITYFKGTFPTETTLFFILGIDAFLEIETWKSHKALFSMIPFVIISRPDNAPSDGGIDRMGVAAVIRSGISPDYRFVRESMCFTHDDRQPIYICDVQSPNISSTQIRHRVRNDRSISALVPATVEKYIDQQGLYR